MFSDPLTSAPGMFECGQISTVELNHSPGMCVSHMSQNSQCTRPPRDSVFPLFLSLCEQNCSCEVSVSNHRTVCLYAWCCELQFWETWSDVTCMRSTCDHARVPELKGELHFCCNVVHTVNTRTWLKLIGMQAVQHLSCRTKNEFVWNKLQTLITNRVCKL